MMRLFFQLEFSKWLADTERDNVFIANLGVEEDTVLIFDDWRVANVIESSESNNEFDTFVEIIRVRIQIVGDSVRATMPITATNIIITSQDDGWQSILVFIHAIKTKELLLKRAIFPTTHLPVRVIRSKTLEFFNELGKSNRFYTMCHNIWY